MLTLTDAERIVLIAAVRSLQNDIDRLDCGGVEDMIFEFEELPLDTQSAIEGIDLDDLAERINFGDQA